MRISRQRHRPLNTTARLLGKPPRCPEYNPGLYTVSELDQMIFVDGFIPVASADEFDRIRSGVSETMGAGTCWEGEYTTGGNKKYVQVLDIDFSGFVGWVRIAPAPAFVYDGNEKNISNLNTESVHYVHLFSNNTAFTIKNMRIHNAYLNKIGTNCGIIGESHGVVENVHIFNSTFIAIGTCAAIVGLSVNGYISDCVVENCTITGGGNTFGIANGSATINNCTVIDTDVSGGAAAGIGGSGNISNCTFSGGSISGSSGGVSGISSSFGNRIVSDCVVENCTITGGGNTFGIANGSATINNCTVIDTDVSGGAAAGIGGSGNISNCTFSGGSISGSSEGVSGISSSFGNRIVSDCVVENCTITSSNHILSGISQARGGALILRCRAENVTISTTSTITRVGGISGLYYQGGSIQECEVVNCVINTPNATGVGGIVGYDQQNSVNIINDCRVVGGSILGNTDVGGIMGRALQSNTTNTNSFSTAAVSGNSNVGGAYGRHSGAAISSVYWDTQASGNPTSAAGTGQTTVQLQTPTSNTGIYANWDPNVWDFGTSSEYPKLINTP